MVVTRVQSENGCHRQLSLGRFVGYFASFEYGSIVNTDIGSIGRDTNGERFKRTFIGIIFSIAGVATLRSKLGLNASASVGHVSRLMLIQVWQSVGSVGVLSERTLGIDINTAAGRELDAAVGGTYGFDVGDPVSTVGSTGPGTALGVELSTQYCTWHYRTNNSVDGFGEGRTVGTVVSTVRGKAFVIVLSLAVG